MASFISTMFVSSPSLPTFPQIAKPLSPVQTLEQSSSCIHLDPSGEIAEHRLSTPTKGSGLDDAMARLLSLTPPDQLSPRTRASPRTGQARERDSEKVENAQQRPSPLRESMSPRAPRADQDTLSGQELQASDQQLELTNSSSPFRNARARPFRQQKSNKGSSSWQLKQFAEATLGSGSLRKAVKLPEGEDINEWLAVNIVDFYNQINLLYGAITEFCKPSVCTEMKATDEFEYLWQDNENYKRPTKMSAPEYIEMLMNWCQSNIDNEQLFPSRLGAQFPKAFPSTLRQMFKRLFRVYAHIYCHHYPIVQHLDLEPHLNTSFKHFCLFVDEHDLASGRDFWGPLYDLAQSMLKSE